MKSISLFFVEMQCIQDNVKETHIVFHKNKFRTMNVLVFKNKIVYLPKNKFRNNVWNEKKYRNH